MIGRQAGSALIVTVGVIALVTALAATSASVVTTNLTDARRTDARAADRAATEAGSNEFFARVIRDDHYFDGADPPYRSHPALAPRWGQLAMGDVLPCSDSYNGVCFQLSVSLEAQPGDPYAKTAIVTVVAATLCPRGPGSPGCVRHAARQRLSQRQFFDYLYFDDLETLDPVLYPDPAVGATAAAQCTTVASARPPLCESVPFLGPDQVLGPVHTNDEYFTTCLNPAFKAGVDRAGWPTTKSEASDPTALEASGGTVFRALPAPACAGSRPNEASGVFERPDVGPTSFALDVSSLTPIASVSDTFAATTSVTLHGDTYSAEGGAHPATSKASRAWPATGVISVTGDVYVSGSACEPVSIAASGSIYIDGDLTYGQDTTCPRAATGLEADDAVVVLPSIGPAGPPVTATSDRTVEAAVLALGRHSCASGAPPPPGASCQVGTGSSVRGGSFYVLGWDSAPASNPPHALHFLGSIATIWRGAIGAFDPTSGELQSGWVKDFAFDRRLRTAQPPYFLEPVGAGWERTDLTDVGAS